MVIFMNIELFTYFNYADKNTRTPAVMLFKEDVILIIIKNPQSIAPGN